MDERQPAKGRGDPRFIEWLSDEAKGWERRGLVTAEQAQAIMSGYGPAGRAAASQKAQARLITILATLGAILVGLGIILFIAGNWERIPQAVRLAMIIVLVPSVYGVGYWLRYVKGYRRVGVAVSAPRRHHLRRRRSSGSPNIQLPPPRPHDLHLYIRRNNPSGLSHAVTGCHGTRLGRLLRHDRLLGC